MKTMVPLRIVDMIASFFFLAYGYFYPSYSTFALYLGILPINFLSLGRDAPTHPSGAEFCQCGAVDGLAETVHDQTGLQEG